MSWHIHPQEVDSVIRLSDGERYTYLIKKIADWEEVWGLANEDGWIQMMDDNGKSLAPIWPHEEFARKCATEEWSDTLPRSIDLDTWRAAWLPGLSNDGRLIAAFPTPSKRSVVVEPSKFAVDLEQELSLYE